MEETIKNKKINYRFIINKLWLLFVRCIFIKGTFKLIMNKLNFLVVLKEYKSILRFSTVSVAFSAVFIISRILISKFRQLCRQI